MVLGYEDYYGDKEADGYSYRGVRGVCKSSHQISTTSTRRSSCTTTEHIILVLLSTLAVTAAANLMKVRNHTWIKNYYSKS